MKKQLAFDVEFGVVNIISKRGRGLNGPQVALETGSACVRKLRA